MMEEYKSLKLAGGKSVSDQFQPVAAVAKTESDESLREFLSLAIRFASSSELKAMTVNLSGSTIESVIRRF